MNQNINNQLCLRNGSPHMNSATADMIFHQYKPAFIDNKQHIRKKYQVKAKYKCTITINLLDQYCVHLWPLIW
jgi:hypothetical protein